MRVPLPDCEAPADSLALLLSFFFALRVLFLCFIIPRLRKTRVVSSPPRSCAASPSAASDGDRRDVS